MTLSDVSQDLVGEWGYFMWRKGRAENAVLGHLKEQGTSGLSETGCFYRGKWKKKTQQQQNLTVGEA